MGRKLKKRMAVSELMVLLCVLFMLASVAIPSYMQFRKQVRLEQLMEEAKNCKKELARWIASADTESITFRGRSSEPEWKKNPADSGSQSDDIHAVLKDFAGFYNENNPNPVTEGPILSLENVRTSPTDCPRDGTIHVIPLVNDEDKVYGAALTVTNLAHRGGPKDDGLLTTFRVLPERNERDLHTPIGR